MTKEGLIKDFHLNHQELIQFAKSLSDDNFMFVPNGKWTAGQQLDHVYLCLHPISQALASKEFILHKFGKIDRPAWSYDLTITKYRSALENGGKAPERFVPRPVELNARETLMMSLDELLHMICNQLTQYSDEELQALVLPHPLLDKLTIYEMISLMSYHATHHHHQAKLNLQIK